VPGIVLYCAEMTDPHAATYLERVHQNACMDSEPVHDMAAACVASRGPQP
jgi:hypothetical protein